MISLRQRSIVGAVAIAIASSGVTVWLMSLTDAKQRIASLASSSSYQNPVSHSPVPAPLEDPALIEKFRKIQAHLDVLDKAFAKLAKKDVKQVSASVLPGIPAKAGLPKADPMVNKQASEKYAIQIENRFQAEETDAAWAGNIAPDIQDVFLAGNLQGNSSLNNVDCRTNLCKLEISYQGNDILTEISDKLVEKLGATLPYGSVQRGKSGNEVTIYLGKRPEIFAP